MSERDAYLQKLKADLDEWNARIDTLEARAAQASGDVRLQYEQQIKSLRHQRAEVASRLAALQEATDDAWEQVKEGLDRAWADLKYGLDKAAAAFK